MPHCGVKKIDKEIRNMTDAVLIRAEITCPACGTVQEGTYPLIKGRELKLQCGICNKTTVNINIDEE